MVGNLLLVGGENFFKCPMIPWMIRTRWLNCLCLSQSIDFMIIHIFKGNACARFSAFLILKVVGFRIDVWCTNLEALETYLTIKD